MRHVGLKLFIDLQPATRVGIEAHPFQPQRFSRPDTADGKQHQIGYELFSRLQINHGLRRFPIRTFHLFDRFPKSKGHAVIPHLMNEFIPDFGIQKFQGPMTAIHQRHVDAEGAEHRSIFQTDHPCAHDDHGAGQTLQAHHFITGDNLRMLVFHAKRRSGNGPHGNHDVLCLHPLQGLFCKDLNGVLVNERRFTPGSP